MDPSITDVACAGLHGMAMGDRNLTVKRANSAVKAQQEQAGGAPMPGALPGLGGMPGGAPFMPQANAARVVKLAHAGALAPAPGRLRAVLLVLLLVLLLGRRCSPALF